MVVYDELVFGKRTIRNEANENSDIDLLLVSDQFGHNKWDNLSLISRVNRKFYMIEPHLYPTKLFIKGDPFVEEIKKVGVEIV